MGISLLKLKTFFRLDIGLGVLILILKIVIVKRVN